MKARRTDSVKPAPSFWFVVEQPVLVLLRLYYEAEGTNNYSLAGAVGGGLEHFSVGRIEYPLRSGEQSALHPSYHGSFERARAERGLELFQRAAQLLAVHAAIDSGFFVYRKRFLQAARAPQRPRVFAPWGQFDDLESLTAVVDEGVADPERLRPGFEQWLALRDLPPRIQRAWAPYGLSGHPPQP